MRIGSSSGVSLLASRLGSANARRVAPGARAASAGEDRGECRALVPIAPTPSSTDEAPIRIVRPLVDAGFLAQLIATAEGLPETRRLRRADPRRAAAAYARTERGEGLLTPGYLVDRLR
ncbi:MAG: hypothetical protein LWW93_03420 [Hyphomicrobiales bacterium]|nr:hypothetical protein [Hyphomicrobiales bacterium]